MSKTPVYIGIDVACAKGKRLPICVVEGGARPVPVGIPHELADAIPKGLGNREITVAKPFHSAARGVAEAIRRAAEDKGWRIERVAIDAPASPPATGSRASEHQLGKCKLPSFRTPTNEKWISIRKECADHLADGKSIATLPQANKIWMLYGFELCDQIRSLLSVEVIEVYPYAIVKALGRDCKHKSTLEGYRCQLEAISNATRWEPKQLEDTLKKKAYGSRHDRLDAFMAAWVASLPVDRRRAYGDEARWDDAIRVPCTEGLESTAR